MSSRKTEKIPEKCANCGEQLSKWKGSHTCVRIQSPKMIDNVLTFSVKYICTDCFWNMFTRKEHDEIIRKFIQEDKKLQSTLAGKKEQFRKLKENVNKSHTLAGDACNEVLDYIDEIFPDCVEKDNYKEELKQ